MQFTTPMFEPMRKLCGKAARGLRQTLEARRKRISLLGIAGINTLLGEWIGPRLFAPQEQGAFSRKRCFDFATTFQAYLWQTLQGQAPCRDAVRQVQAARAAAGEPIPDSGTAAFCHARTRLPLERLEKINTALIGKSDRLTRDEDRWLGREVKILDGTSLCMDDTHENAAVFDYPSGQKEGCGFPALSMAALFSLSSGAWLGHEISGSKKHDLALSLDLIQRQIGKGDVLLADRAFCAYWLLALLVERGADAVVRLNQARRADFRQGKKLGPADRLLHWKKPPRGEGCPLDAEQYARLPEELSVRILRRQLAANGQRTREIVLATTLCDHLAVSADDLFELYARRWQIELNFDDIKTTLAMDHLHCKSPAMVERAIQVFQCAYNMIRTLMLEAAVIRHAPVRRLSFKGSANALVQWFAILGGKSSAKQRAALWETLLEIVAEDLVPERPHRREPRAVKKRPKNYPRLTAPRKKYKEIPHRSRYSAKKVLN